MSACEHATRLVHHLRIAVAAAATPAAAASADAGRPPLIDAQVPTVLRLLLVDVERAAMVVDACVGVFGALADSPALTYTVYGGPTVRVTTARRDSVSGAEQPPPPPATAASTRRGSLSGGRYNAAAAPPQIVSALKGGREQHRSSAESLGPARSTAAQSGTASLPFPFVAACITAGVPRALHAVVAAAQAPVPRDTSQAASLPEAPPPKRGMVTVSSFRVYHQTALAAMLEAQPAAAAEASPPPSPLSAASQAKLEAILAAPLPRRTIGASITVLATLLHWRSARDALQGLPPQPPHVRRARSDTAPGSAAAATLRGFIRRVVALGVAAAVPTSTAERDATLLLPSAGVAAMRTAAEALNVSGGGSGAGAAAGSKERAGTVRPSVRVTQSDVAKDRPHQRGSSGGDAGAGTADDGASPRQPEGFAALWGADAAAGGGDGSSTEAAAAEAAAKARRQQQEQQPQQKQQQQQSPSSDSNSGSPSGPVSPTASSALPHDDPIVGDVVFIFGEAVAKRAGSLVLQAALAAAKSSMPPGGPLVAPAAATAAIAQVHITSAAHRLQRAYLEAFSAAVAAELRDGCARILCTLTEDVDARPILAAASAANALIALAQHPGTSPHLQVGMMMR